MQKTEASSLYMKTRTKSFGDKEYDVTVIPSSSYAESLKMGRVMLKKKDHIATFKTVMKNFDIEMVIRLALFFPLRKKFTKITITSMHPSFNQVAHDDSKHGPVSNTTLFEYIWGRCKLCSQEVNEMRVFGDSSHLEKIISVTDHPAYAQSVGFGCRLFEKHLHLSGH